ncbi:MAG: ATP-binding cassette domain-containing protein [Planctomycetes bacterium]|nr:ATP-binding cassette domain-containing protein [Planctomycetota bacterium]
MPALLEARAITKKYPGVAALDGVTFSIASGEVAGLLGENGAGKSTLVGVLGGAIAPDRGELYLSGERIRLRSPADAAAAGIGVVHQHESLILRFSVAENIALAAGLPAFPKRAAMIDAARRLADRYGLNPGDPAAPCESLSVGERQRVEILKALSRNPRILLLDEPTAALSPREVAELFHVIVRLRDAGVAVALVDHKLHEVLRVCGRVVILRRGKVVADMLTKDSDERGLATAMIGKAPAPPARAMPAREGEIVFSVDGVSTRGRIGSLALRSINIKLSRGEILGIAGVDGNGQREFVDYLLSTRDSAGRPTTAFIPPDRRGEGLILSFGVDENLLLDETLLRNAAPAGYLSPRTRAESSAAAIVQYNIRAASSSAKAATLSGGNQQKIVVARAMARRPGVLVAAHATRGLDVEAASFVHGEILNFTKNGGAVIYISTDLDEIAALCHRTLVFARGSALGPFEIPWSAADFEAIGAIMAGGGR